MPRWKALPAQLDPRVRQLLVRLRRLKDHGGLTMRQLEARTGYSATSWERYLNGRSLPPRDAVEALARLGGDDVTRLLALHEVAGEAWREGAAPTAVRPPAPEVETTPETGAVIEAGTTPEQETTPEAETAPEPEPPPSPGPAADPDPGPVPAPAPEGSRMSRRALGIALVAGCAALVLAVSCAVLVALRVLDDGKSGAPKDAARAAPTAQAPAGGTPRTYGCRMERTGGRWYAGNSRATDATVAYGDQGPQVAEVQCLLRRAGISPGGIDGMFGPLTMGAVERFQIRARLHVDGIAGPHTWEELRR
ncbi:peptidoglycan-binding protein [Streptomyces sp. J2-1]|uniref:peptidoglycan-binding protein n=1 Tax=Streptomyces corallincola TaxID=2851888 RepID=UPI001C38393B|nr:peptidoglycan-binding protein [Streptomyces corallincola]MBV2357745.1 peptidoglycan-binding protein [Streptomyces corallincola]